MRVMGRSKRKLLMAVGLVAVTCTLFVPTRSRAQSKLSVWEERRQEEIRATHRAGIPTKPADLRPAERQPEQNAATYLAKLREVNKVSQLSAAEVDALENLSRNGSAPTPDQVAQAKKVIEAHPDQFRLDHQIAACSVYDSGPQKRTGSGSVIPIASPSTTMLRECARELLGESMVLLYQGKPVEAAQTDALIFGLARLAVSRGSILSFMSGGAIDSLALNGLRTILYQSGDDPAAADAIVHAIDTHYKPLRLSAALGGEIVDNLAMREEMLQQIPQAVRGNPTDKANPPFEKTADYRTWTQKYHYPTDPKLALSRCFSMNDVHYLVWMRRVLTFVDKPYPEALVGIRPVFQEAEQKENDPDCMMAAMEVMAATSLPIVKARHEASGEVLRTAAALVAWKDRHGHFPATLAECFPTPPRDPFDLHPLRYRKAGDGFLLYSVGQTGKFDGGKPNVAPRSEARLYYPRTADLK